MTGIPVPTGGPPQSMRQGISDAMQPEEGAEGELPEDPAQEMSEIEARIVRLEEVLVGRGVLTEGDLTGPAGSDPNGEMPVDPAAAPPGAPAPGAPPAPGGGY